MNKNRNNFKKRKYNVSRTVGISMNTMLARDNLTELHTGASLSLSDWTKFLLTWPEVIGCLLKSRL